MLHEINDIVFLEIIFTNSYGIFCFITAFEMMKLFVFANTIMLIVTMAWPHIKEQFYMLNQWWDSKS